jgi:DNA-binding MarR family transcriptional regulator
MIAPSGYYSEIGISGNEREGSAMVKKTRTMKKLDDLNAQMIVVREFMDEFYDKTVFQDERNLSSDLTASQIKSLFAFRDEDQAYPVGELRKNARVKRSTITDMIDRLERDGIAERLRDEGDRRVVKVRLTQKGKKIRREFYQKRRKEMETIFSKLTEQQKKKLLSHLIGASQILRKI